MVLQLVAHHGALQHCLQGVLIPFLPEPAEFKVSRSDHKCQLFVSIPQQLVDAVCQTLGKLSLLFIKNQVLSQRPRCSIGKFGIIGTFPNPSFRPKSTRRHLGWGDEHRQEHLGAKPQRPCSTAPLPSSSQYDSSATSHMGKVILLMVSIFCPYLYLWPRGKHLSHTQVPDLFEILGHQILFTRHIPPYMASCSFQGSV